MIQIKKLIDQHGGQVKLAAAMGKSQGQISKWLALDAWVDIEVGKVYTPSSNFEWQSGQSGAIVELQSQGVISMAVSEQKPKDPPKQENKEPEDDPQP